MFPFGVSWRSIFNTFKCNTSNHDWYLELITYLILQHSKSWQVFNRGFSFMITKPNWNIFTINYGNHLFKQSASSLSRNHLEIWLCTRVINSEWLVILVIYVVTICRCRRRYVADRRYRPRPCSHLSIWIFTKNRCKNSRKCVCKAGEPYRMTARLRRTKNDTRNNYAHWSELIKMDQWASARRLLQKDNGTGRHNLPRRRRCLFLLK